MTARTGHAAHFIFRRRADDRVSDIACACRTDCYRSFGGMPVSADIIRFIPRPKRDDEQSDFPTIAFRSAVPTDDLPMDHADASPSEYICPDE